MQGRLVNSEKKNSLQYFPANNWKKEIIIANNLGFKVMEWTINYENIKKNHLYNEAKNKELKNFLKNNNIIINSVTCDFFMQKPFFKNKKYIKTLDILKKVIQLSKKINIKFIVLPLVDKSSIKNSLQEKTLVKKINKIAKYLGPKQKILFEIDYNPKKILNFIKNFNNKFGINYDTGNSAFYNYNFKEEIEYFKYVHNIHLKDRYYLGESVRLGTGNCDFNLFFKLIKKIKYSGNLILQTARNKNHVKEILANKSFVEKYL